MKCLKERRETECRIHKYRKRQDIQRTCSSNSAHWRLLQPLQISAHLKAAERTLNAQVTDVLRRIAREDIRNVGLQVTSNISVGVVADTASEKAARGTGTRNLDSSGDKAKTDRVGVVEDCKRLFSTSGVDFADNGAGSSCAYCSAVADLTSVHGCRGGGCAGCEGRSEQSDDDGRVHCNCCWFCIVLSKKVPREKGKGR